MAEIDDDIDRLYQIGLGAFVAERNALARRTKRADVKALEKPGAPAWAVNQLFWHDRDVFDRLVAAAEAVRGAHRALLSGTTADVRGAETTHRDALRAALTSARRFLTEGGLAASPATLDAVRRTLEALPHAEANGRLSKPLAPLGLDALAGLTLATPRQSARVVAMPPRGPAIVSTPTSEDEARAAARRAEALAARRLEAAEAEVAAAQAALVTAETRLADAERDVAARRHDRDAARSRVEAALRAVRTIDDIG